MKKKYLSRILCALLSVLMMVSVVPILSVSADEGTGVVGGTEIDYTKVAYPDALARLADMTLYAQNDTYELWCDEKLAVVAYRDKRTDEVLFTNPWNMLAEPHTEPSVRNELMSQILLTYIRNDAKDVTYTLNSFADAALKDQISIDPIKNGVRVEYAIGERSARILVPMIIERETFIKKIAKPLQEALGKSEAYTKVLCYFNPIEYTTAKGGLKEQYANNYPVTAEKGINLYVFNEKDKNISTLRTIESYILKYCTYSFEEMDNDYDFVNYTEPSTSPPVFKMALEYKLDANKGLVVSLPANGLRYDEAVYRVTNLQILPYMGATLKNNVGKTGEEGYSFIPDGSGTTYKLSTPLSFPATRVYGEDYALLNGVSGGHSEPIRVPVFGQVEAEYDETTDTTVRRGYMAIIEEGASMASLTPQHRSYMEYTSVVASFITRPTDRTESKWDVYATRRYTDDYTIRYILLSDDVKAQTAGLTSYYECSWMGMACAYRDYLASTNPGFQRLTDADVNPTQIPLYIETFGCMDTIEKVLSMPVTVSVALTTFEQVGEMYDFLSGGENGIVNINFKLKGYANGGLYADVPYKLKWEKAVGGKSDFKDLIAKAVEKGFGVYPDFDFVYTSQADGGNAVKMKENAARTIDNRYTSKRVYSATQQTLVSYYQMVMAPATYSKFYEKLEKRYSKYEGATGISLSTFGNALNADYDEDKTALREETMGYVTEALAYFKDRGYDIMLDGGNAYTWNYADHILNVPLDSSRFTSEMASVPFVGVVLHGYVEFAGSALNMEGDIGYAMLKAMENGASIYFILSYANTELLKEDVLLSQNYSVRYDIWQNRLVEIYKELNAVLHDVQTKLIIGYERLEGHRVPDVDELLEDILKDAQEKADKVEELLDKEHNDRVASVANAKLSVQSAANYIRSRKNAIQNVINNIDPAQTALEGNLVELLLQQWNLCLSGLGTATPEEIAEAHKTLADRFDKQLLRVYVPAIDNAESAGQYLVTAKLAYDYLRETSVAYPDYCDPYVVSVAREQLVAAVEEYVALLNVYETGTTTISDANKNAFVDGDYEQTQILSSLILEKQGANIGFTNPADAKAYVFGTLANANAYATLGATDIYNAYVLALQADGFYDPADSANSVVDVDALYEQATKKLTPPDVPPEAPKLEIEYDKYAIDNSIVRVTYGQNMGEAYKTLILNFNDYAVQTVYNGVTYTIEGYGYVVVYH